MIFTIIVTIVGVAMSLSYYPQAYRIYQRKKSKDVSLLTFLTLAIGTTVWFLYGVLTKDIPIIASFALGSIGSMLVLGLSIAYREK